MPTQSTHFIASTIRQFANRHFLERQRLLPINSNDFFALLLRRKRHKQQQIQPSRLQQRGIQLLHVTLPQQKNLREIRRADNKHELVSIALIPSSNVVHFQQKLRDHLLRTRRNVLHFAVLKNTFDFVEEDNAGTTKISQSDSFEPIRTSLRLGE